MLSYSRKLLFYLVLLIPFLVGSVKAEDVTLDKKLDVALKPVADVLESIIFFSVEVKEQGLPLVLVILAGTSIFLTIYFKFLNIRAVGLAVKTVRGKYTRADAPGEITHFQALTAALSATVGLGNIAGVAVAIGLGGPGATFWMIVVGLCSMTTKFCECTLGVKYRTFSAEGKVQGGAMYYLSQGLKERGLGRLGKVLAVFFAIMCVGGAIGAGNMFQVNQATEQMSNAFGIFTESKVVFGGIIAAFVGLVIIGGIVAIARVTSFLVPIMCGIYVIAALAIIVLNIELVGDALKQIVMGAFSPMAVGGGLVGVLIQGVQRAAFSNEAGIGSAPIAHSAVKTDKPASEGMVALLEPFTDTVVVCTMTAVVLIITGAWKVDAVVKDQPVNLYQTAAMSQVVGAVEDGEQLRIISTVGADESSGLDKRAEVWRGEEERTVWVHFNDEKTDGLKRVEGIEKTSMAFGGQFEWFPQLLAIAVLLFAFSSMISWSYYGEQAVIYLCGGANVVAVLLYKFFFCMFVVIGSVVSLGNVLRVSDAMIFAMVIPNMVGLYFLLPVVKRELADFRQHVEDIESSQ